MSAVSLIAVTNIDAMWPALRGGFHEACLATGGDIDTGDLWVQCRSGAAFLLVAHDGDEVLGASIWRPDTWATGRRLRCLALYGRKARRWIFDMRALVEKLKADTGSIALVAEGRCGPNGEPIWQHFFPKAKAIRVLYEERT
jgi:hypothetical protein